MVDILKQKAIKAGADYVTVCAAADILTVKGAFKATQIMERN